jgi:TetR/AcrR family transcriptional repressor of nem operon
MRVSKEQAAENRERILKAAATLIRERGISGVGVDALTEAAGLTHGSAYSQFGSKDRLVAEALSYALSQNAENVAQAPDLKSYIRQYLSVSHRDAPGQGCALAALGCEMSQSTEAVRSRFTACLCGIVDHVGELFGKGRKRRRDEQALAAIATMVGALILSRAVNDPEFANRILDVSRRSLIASSEG